MTVKPTGDNANAASPKTGFFEALLGLFPSQGIGTPKIRSRRLVLSVFATMLGVLLLVSAPALAAGVEAPETGVPGEVTATTVSLGGTLNPHAPGVAPGEEYVFFYSSGGSACNEGAVAVAPEPFGMVGQGEREMVLPLVVVGGLQPNTVYTVCLAARYLGEEWAYGNPQTFKTVAVKPTILSVTAPAHPKASEVRLEAVIDPNNEPTECHFQYGTGTVTENEGVCEQGNALVGGEQGVSLNVTGLAENTVYKYVLVVSNATGTSQSIPGEFKTAIPPAQPELTGEPAGTGASLKGVLNPNNPGNPGTYEFLYRQSSASSNECTGPGEHATPAQAQTGTVGELAPGEVTGLLPNTQYTFCLRAHNEAGEQSALSSPVSVTTLQVEPTPGTESFTNVGSSSATLHASVNPGGAPTSYFFEYGPTTAYGSTTASQSAGAGTEPVSVLANIENLQPDTEYHFRVVLDSTQGEPHGQDIIFSTLPLAAQGLPDGRGYELVSPLDNGHVTVVPGRPGVRAAADGSKVTYLTTIPPTGGIGHGEPPASEIQEGVPLHLGDNQNLAERLPGSGWTAVNVQPTGINTAVYQSFSSDLSEAIVQSEEPLSENAPGGGYAGLYLQSLTGGGYSSLFSRTPSHFAFPGQFEVSYAGASVGGSHRLFEANEALLEGVTPAAKELNTFAGEKAVHPLYDWTGGRLLAVDVLPNGHVAPEASYGSPEVLSNFVYIHRLDRVVSADGSRIFWTDTGTEATVEDPAGLTRLFVRENDASPEASTVQIDASQAPTGTGATETRERLERSGGGVFMTANTEGSKVYFTDDRKLTADSNAALGEPDLYVYDFAPPAGQPNLTDLTATVENPGKEHANVKGVLGSSEDGSYVYFAAAGALTPEAKPQECLPPTEGRGTSFCNVYALHIGEAPSLVAKVTYVDGEGGASDEGEAAVRTTQPKGEEASGDWVPAVGDRLAEVSPDGRHLVFESVVPQPSQNSPDFDGGGSREIYLYGVGSGLSCVSCDPVGAPSLSSEHYAEHFELAESFSLVYALRDMSANGGRVFFNSKEALVGNDGNGRTDVYEWERDGAGSCGRVKGCLYLLSGGTSAEYSAFLDASASGDDVFIESRAQLTPQDHGEAYAVYDVRVGAPRESVSPVCSGAGCQGVPAAPPIFATPSSVTFSGVGNFPPPSASLKVTTKTITCRKGFVEKRGKCVRKPRRRSTVKRSAKGRK
jgi:hypothetical protein